LWLFFLFLFSAPLPAQTAAEMDRLLDTKETAYAQAAYFILASALDEPPEDPSSAFALALEKGWFPGNAGPDSLITLRDLSLLMMGTFGLERGLMCRLFPGPRYAFREMTRQGFIEGRAYPGHTVSGERFLRILGNVLSRAGDADRGEPAAIKPRAAAKAPPFDFGVALNQRAELRDGENFFGAAEYAGTALPWLAAPLGNRADLYLSGGFSAEHIDEEWKPLPEIHRFELTCDPLPGLRIEIGRIPFRGNSYSMAGLFDGLSFRLNTGGGQLSGGVFYTGLLYKKSASIVISPEDRANYNDRDGYFASRRLAAEINWERGGIFATRNTLSVSGAAQFDLNDTDAPFHSQYLQANMNIPLGGSLNTAVGALVELAEVRGKDPYAAFVLSTEIQWMLPTALQDRLSFAGWFSSGKWNDRIGAFSPLVMQARGRVLRPEPSGLALVETAYTVRLHPRLAADLSGAYYFRTDRATFQNPGMDPLSASPLLGGELCGGLSWAPFSDLLISAGGGVFFPRTGKVFSDDADPVFRVTLEAGISF
jgi:hypothetical protein